MSKAEKRSARITVRMTPREFQRIQEAHRKRWPELAGIASKSDVLRRYALIAAECEAPRRSLGVERWLKRVTAAH
jgi:hypothetical protein